MKKTFKSLSENHRILLSYLAFFAGVGFGIAGIAIYPPGVINGSVLIMIGLLFILSAGLVGLDVKFDLNNKYFHAKQGDTYDQHKDENKEVPKSE